MNWVFNEKEWQSKLPLYSDDAKAVCLTPILFLNQALLDVNPDIVYAPRGFRIYALAINALKTIFFAIRLRFARSPIREQPAKFDSETFAS